jgi:hypothetical protein
VRIIFNFRFAIFDRGRKPVRAWSSCFSMSLFPIWNSSPHEDKDMLKVFAHGQELHTRRPSHYVTVRVVKVVLVKNRTCNPLMVNGVKPSQGESNHLTGLTVKRPDPDGSTTSKTRVNTLKYAYERLNSHTAEKYFLRRHRKLKIRRTRATPSGIRLASGVVTDTFES